jgi:Sec63 Brl domain
VIMTELNQRVKYEQIASGHMDTVESQLESGLCEHINAEVSRLVITDVPSALRWVKSTFMYARKRCIAKQHEEELERDTKQLVVRILNDLAQYKLLSYDDDMFGLTPLVAGTLMAKYYISFSTMKAFVPGCKEINSPSDALKLVAQAHELTEGVFVRRAEKKKLNALNEAIRHPGPEKVKSPEDKVYILLQAALGGKEDLLADDYGLQNEARKLLQSSGRVAKVLSLLLLDSSGTSGQFTPALSALQVSRAMNNSVFWSGSSCIRQCPGVGPAYAKLLVAAGVASIKSLANLHPRTIESILGKNPPFGNELLSRLAATIPCFAGAVESRNPSAKEGESARLRLLIEVKKANWVCRPDARTSGEVAGAGDDVRKNKSPGRAMDHIGFVLVGGHSEKILHYQTFRVPKQTQGEVPPLLTLNLAIPRCRRETRSRWVDVVIGSNFSGCDFHHRVHVSGTEPETVEDIELRVGDGGDGGCALLNDGEQVNMLDSDTIAVANAMTQKENFPSKSKIVPNVCRHKCKDRKLCKHRCCKAHAVLPRADTVKAYFRKASKTTISTFDNLQSLRRQSRPLTSALPIKRLRETSPTGQLNEISLSRLEGSRLAPFAHAQRSQNHDIHVVPRNLERPWSPVKQSPDHRGTTTDKVIDRRGVSVQASVATKYATVSSVADVVYDSIFELLAGIDSRALPITPQSGIPASKCQDSPQLEVLEGVPAASMLQSRASFAKSPQVSKGLLDAPTEKTLTRTYEHFSKGEVSIPTLAGHPIVDDGDSTGISTAKSAGREETLRIVECDDLVVDGEAADDGTVAGLEGPDDVEFMLREYDAIFANAYA